jgi:hypothetical protein
MLNKIIPPEVPFIDKGLKYAKVAIITIVVVSIVIAGLITWIVTHFISRAW